ncbi:MAG: triose-phosphate isomerase [Cellvibrionaceae bacterium]
MRQPLVIGNWKMHGSLASVTELVNQLEERLGDFEGVGMAVCPPFVFLPQVALQLGACNIAWGAQNLSEQVEGAFTGEVSASMLREFGSHYVIVGHSERRSLCGETDSLVAEKAAKALEEGLIPVICVGETLEQRESGEALDVIAKQLSAVSKAVLAKSVVAYEPVWAIGTGKTATPEQAQEVHAYIRQQLGEDGAAVRILYGGSVKAGNAAELFSQPDIDGGLIGGASLVAEDFEVIVKAAKKD